MPAAEQLYALSGYSAAGSAKKDRQSRQTGLDPEQTRAAFEATLVEAFSELADLFGNPRSPGHIYGLLFTSPDPLGTEEIASRLDSSLGSTSQGLRVLEEFEAVERDTSGRSPTFRAKTELKTLIAGFVHRRLLPRIEANLARLDALELTLASIPPDAVRSMRWRLEHVAKWHRRALKPLPLARKMMSAC